MDVNASSLWAILSNSDEGDGVSFFNDMSKDLKSPSSCRDAFLAVACVAVSTFGEGEFFVSTLSTFAVLFLNNKEETDDLRTPFDVVFPVLLDFDKTPRGTIT